MLQTLSKTPQHTTCHIQPAQCTLRTRCTRTTPATCHLVHQRKQSPSPCPPLRWMPTHSSPKQHTKQQQVGQHTAHTPALALGAAACLLALALDVPAAHALTFETSTYVPGLVGDSPFNEGFVSSFLLILFSEIGDKTFFIAVLLALQQSRSAVFVGTFGALAVMTVVSVGLGQVFHQLDELLPAVPGGFPLDDALAVALLVFFGLTTLAGAFKEGEDDEEAEAKEVVAAFSGGASATLVLSTFALVFAAEWGDKSFLATIALAAASSPAGVIAGAVTGHGVATALAVLGGSVLGKYASEKVIQIAGGTLFLVFAAATAFDVVTGAH